MPTAFFVLLGFQLLGEAVRSAARLPLPGPVIGMFLLTLALTVGRRNTKEAPILAGLAKTADLLIRNMGLLFVPAGVGIMAEAGVLRREWLPIVAGIVGSTVLSLVITGLVMHYVNRASEDGGRATAERETTGIAGEDA